MNTETKPTEAALKCADELDLPRYGRTREETVTTTAHFIDLKCQLPQKNAALFAAQAVVDAWDRNRDEIAEGGWREVLTPIRELRDALAQIK